MIKELGINNWKSIAESLLKMEGGIKRSGKQCRERWHNHLDPNINKEPWTASEYKLLFELQG